MTFSKAQTNHCTEAIRAFLPETSYTLMSLGQNCNPAWYLKQTGGKKFSCPFDWIFSSADIIEHCLTTGFAEFLNPDHIYPIRNGDAAGHKLYHSSLFNHRNPAKSSEHLEYYQRCVQRFRDDLHNNESTIYLCNLVNEPDKRIGWRDGFDRSFRLPLDQSTQTYASVIEKIKQHKKNAKFIFFDMLTNTEPQIVCKQKDESIFLIEIYASGNNNGTYFEDEAADTLCHHIFSSLKENQV